MKLFCSRVFSGLFVCLVMVSLVGCHTLEGDRVGSDNSVNSDSNGSSNPRGNLPILCEEPRPQICTMHYAPVCAVSADGRRSTKSNACSACGDDRIVKVYVGECASTD